MTTMKFQKFKALTKSWKAVFEEAAEFASNLGQHRVVSISHSCDHCEAVVTVWYWDK